MVRTREQIIDDLLGRKGRSRAPARTEMPNIPGVVGKTLLSGVAGAANFLDLPGSMIRDTIALSQGAKWRDANPFDQLATPFRMDNRLYGRDILRQAGMIGKKDTWGNFAGGLGIDILTDPLTYLTLGAKTALTPGGRALAKAGVLPHAMEGAIGTRVARPGVIRAFGSAITGRDLGRFGPRTFNVGTTVGEALHLADRSMGAAAGTARARLAATGLTSPQIDTMLSSRVGGAIGVGLPMANKQIFTIGGRRTAQVIDAIGGAARFNPVSRRVAAIFGHRNRDAVSEASQRTAVGHTLRESEAMARTRQQIAPIEEAIQRGGFTTVDDSAAMYAYIEGGRPLPAHMSSIQHHLDELKRIAANAPDAERSAGLQSNLLGGGPGSYGARVRNPFPDDVNHARSKGVYASGVEAYARFSPHQIGRKPGLREVGSGTGSSTAALQRMSQDANYVGQLHNPAIANDPVARRALRLRFETTYAADLPSVYILAHGGRRARREALAANNALFKFIGTLDPRHVSQKTGAFVHSPAEGLLRRMQHGSRATEASNTIRNVLAESVVLPGGPTHGTVSLLSAIEGVGKQASKRKQRAPLLTNREQIIGGHAGDKWRHRAMIDRLSPAQLAAADAELSRRGLNRTLRNRLRVLRVDGGTVRDLLRTINDFDAPAAVNSVIAAIDRYTAFDKTFKTSLHPAFHIRNLGSGAHSNVAHGLVSLARVLKANMNARAILRDEKHGIRGAAKWPMFAGRSISDYEATREIAQLAWSHRVQGNLGYGSDLAGSHGRFGGIDITGIEPMTGVMGVTTHMGSKAPKGATWNPLKIAGVSSTSENFWPSIVGRDVGNYAEGLNRLSGFTELLRKGVDPAEAARRVKLAQVDYQALSKTEREVMRRMFPFYTFTRGASEAIISDIMARPGGKWGQTLRVMGRAHHADPVATPDYIADTASVRLASPDGGKTDRYITGFGLMHEDPFSFLGSGMRGFLLEAGSRLNPLVKGPLEWMTNQSFFQKGPEGGRPLDDLDPTVGRLIANITGSRRTDYLPKSAEFLLSNSPASRFLSTARMLTDTRKSPQIKALSFGSGLRIADVGEAAKDAIIRERVSQAMRQMGASEFVRTYFPQERLESMREGKRITAQELQQLVNILANRAKARKEAREAEAKSAKRP